MLLYMRGSQTLKQIICCLSSFFQNCEKMIASSSILVVIQYRSDDNKVALDFVVVSKLISYSIHGQ